jgi:transposase
MKMFVSPPRIYLHRQFVDFRKSINGLSVIVESEMDLPIMSGGLFIFCNKAKDKLKILYWDKTGFALWYKRLKKTSLSGQTVLMRSAWNWMSSSYLGCLKAMMSLVIKLSVIRILCDLTR